MAIIYEEPTTTQKLLWTLDDEFRTRPYCLLGLITGLNHQQLEEANAGVEKEIVFSRLLTGELFIKNHRDIDRELGMKIFRMRLNYQAQKSRRMRK